MPPVTIATVTFAGDAQPLRFDSKDDDMSGYCPACDLTNPWMAEAEHTGDHAAAQPSGPPEPAFRPLPRGPEGDYALNHPDVGHPGDLD